MAKKKRDIKVSFVDEPASEGVTGSGVYIETPNHKILLDYGLAQSNDKYEDFLVNNRKTKEFKANMIQRLKSSVCTPEGSMIYSNILIDFERIGDHLLNITENMVNVD